MSRGNLLQLQGTESAQGRYDDQQGNVTSAVSGAAVWGTYQIGTTGVWVNTLQDGQNDYYQNFIQFTHRKALQTVIPSFHLHYILTQAPTNGQTVILEWAYTLVPSQISIPTSLAGWSTGTFTITFNGTEVANRHYIANIIPNIPAPPSETYSTFLIVRILRRSQGGGADTYPGDFGLLGSDAHFQTNKFGSVQEYQD